MRRAALFLLLCLLVASCSSTAAGPGSLPPLSSAPSPAVPTPSAGPTGSPSPVASPAPAPAPAPSPSPSPAAVVPLPPAATALTAAGAEAFARYWFDLLSRSYADMDPSYLETVSAPACSTCKNYAASLRRLAAEGLSYQDGGWVVRSVAAAPLEGSATGVTVTADLLAGRLVDRAGTTQKLLPLEANLTHDLEVRWVVDHWVVAAVSGTE